MERLSCDALVVGAGVVGLAAARSLPSSWSRLLIDSWESFGRETSSRNSEVIHSGIYYPETSNKTAWCLDGREALYAYCETNRIAFRKTGKLLMAVSAEERESLAACLAHARRLGVPAELWSRAEVKAREPEVEGFEALFFPESGIVDSHALMASLEGEFVSSGGTAAYGHRLTDLSKAGTGWRATVAAGNSTIEIDARIVINAAGLGAARLSNWALGTTHYEHRFCRGRYLALSPRWRGRFKALVYPLPAKDGLGIHVTMDLAGQARLGPDVDWDIDERKPYECDWESLRAPFFKAASPYLPNLRAEDLSPGLLGIRPKLYIDDISHPDFLVEARQGFIHCLGIESPGLTACLVIGKEVAKLARDAVG